MLAQTAMIVRVAIQSIPARWGASLVVVLGIAGVVGVMVSILAMAEGLRTSFADAGRADRVVVLRNGDTTGTSSSIAREQVPAIVDAPGLMRDADGRPLASVEKIIITSVSERSTGNDVNVVIRGVNDQAFKVRPEVRLVAGRLFAPERHEMIVGRTAQAQYSGLELGQAVQLENTRWTVVGIFDTGGTVHDSELWADVEQVLDAYSMTGHYASVTAVLESEAAFQTYKDALTTNPQLGHYPLREAEYYEAQSARLGTTIRGFGYGVAAIMALGALFSAVNTLFAAVRARTVEIATLRALGFSAAPIVLSVMIEALALCLAGGLLGGGLAFLIFNGYSVSTLNGQTFSQVAFQFQVSSGLLAQGLLGSCVIAVLGALPPAWRAARVPVVDALRGD